MAILKKKHIDKLHDITGENEKWATIPDYDGYFVSNQGRVYSCIKNDLLCPTPTYNDYLRVPLRNENGKRDIRLHRLVAEAFIPNPENKPTVDHRDGVKANCAASNLRWATSSEQQQFAVKQGSKKTKTNKRNQKKLQERIEAFQRSQSE